MGRGSPIALETTMNPLALTAFLFQYDISPRRQSLEAIEATRHSGTLLQHQEERTHSKNGIKMYLFQKGENKQGTYSEESVNEGLITT